LDSLYGAFTHLANLAVTMPKVNNWFEWNLEHSSTICRGLAMADFSRDSHSSQAKYFCQVSNARFYLFPIGQISQNLNTTCWLVSRWKLSEQNF